ncbi:hypothetical protein MUP07_07850 [Candidatus Bathyarchaeota archaeon]|nr:hypothetical protein [Candidatus Bathyarchaeota archaeon]
MAKSAPLSRWAILSVAIAMGFVFLVLFKFGHYVSLSESSLLGTIEVCGMLMSTMVLTDLVGRRQIRATSVMIELSCCVVLLGIYYMSTAPEMRVVSLILATCDTLFCFVILVYYSAQAAIARTKPLLGVDVDVFQERLTPKGHYKYVLPQVGFEFANASKSHVTARITVSVFLGVESVGGVAGDRHGYYRGEMPLEQDPGFYWGNFHVPDRCVDSTETLRLQVEASLVAASKTEHKLVRCFTYMRDRDSWFPEAATFENLKKRAIAKGYHI